MRPLWSVRLPASPAGLHLAREAGLILIRDLAGNVSLHDAAGRPVVQRPVPGQLTASAIAEDGSCAACGTARGEVRLLREELTPGWERTLPARVAALALDPLGRFLAASDDAGGLTVFDNAGREAWRVTTPRPLSHLAWVPETGALAGSADFGLVCLHAADGASLWRDALVAHVGGLSVSGDGKRLLVACYTEGLKRYDVGKAAPVGKDVIARQVVQSYAGDVILTAGLEGTILSRRDGEGKWLAETRLPAPAVGLAMDALGGWAVAALAGGEMTRLEW